MTDEMIIRRLSEILNLQRLGVTEVAETYKIPLDNAENYVKTKTIAICEVLIDELQEDIKVRDGNLAKVQHE